MNILSVSVVFPPAWHHGGPPVTAHALAKALIRQGHSVLAVSTGDQRKDGSPVLDRLTEWDEVPVIYCRRWSLPYLSYSRSLVHAVRALLPEHDVALVHSMWQHAGPAASRICREMGIPYIAYPKGGFDPWGWRRGHLRRLRKAVYWTAMERGYFHGAAAIVGLTRSEVRSIRAVMGPRVRIECIPNGVDVSHYQIGSARAVLEQRYPALRNRRVILFLSRLHPKKGLLEVLPAVGHVVRHFPDVLLVVAGSSQEGYRQQLERKVGELGLEKHVTFTGQITGCDKVGFLQAAELFILPSFSEGLPVAVLEAMACGKPVVITHACNLPEVTEAGAGIEIDHSGQEFTRAVMGLLQDETTREQMGANASKLVQERFTWDRVASMTAALCEDVAKSHG